VRRAASAVQIATSACAWLAQESGGGLGGAARSGRAPATHSSSARRPSASVSTWRGIVSAQNIVKCGAANLLRAGRFSQIWNRSSGLGASVRSSGNISLCWMPRPAVSHCTSPSP
jgi:hypothetical protein